MGTLAERVALITGVPWIEPSDVSEAAAWLCSETARSVTGTVLPTDAGNTGKVG